MRRTIVIALAMSIACEGPAPSIDGGMSDSGTDAALDAGGGDGCTPVTVRNWQLALFDDVSIVYRARIEPNLSGEPWDLYLDFRRFAVDYVGTFPLTEGMDANYSDCAHCVAAFYGTTLNEGYFARAGTMTLRRDPFEQHLDVTLEGVVLEEVTIEGDTLTSVPVPGGACISLAETTITQTFPPERWSCPADQFDDNTTCHCNCGAPDPDCGPQCFEIGCDPGPLPTTGCDADEICTFEASCSATCDHGAREACASGVCGYSTDGDRCFAGNDARVDMAADVGDTCQDDHLYCAIDAEGFAMGLCDIDTEWLCRPACDDISDCTTPGDECYSIFVHPFTGTPQGFCKPAPPPCIESGGSCSDHLDCCTVLCEAGGICA